MSTLARLERLRLSHLADKPRELKKALDERLSHMKITPAERKHLETPHPMSKSK